MLKSLSLGARKALPKSHLRRKAAEHDGCSSRDAWRLQAGELRQQQGFSRLNKPFSTQLILSRSGALGLFYTVKAVAELWSFLQSQHSFLFSVPYFVMEIFTLYHCLSEICHLKKIILGASPLRNCLETQDRLGFLVVK